VGRLGGDGADPEPPAQGEAMTRAAPPPPGPGRLSYARVAVGRPLPEPLTYYIPEKWSEVIRVGSLVAVPLRSEEAAGFVIDLADKPDIRPQLVRPIARPLSPDYTLEPELIDLGRWIADYYFASLGETLATVSMIGLSDVRPRTRTLLRLAHVEHWLTRNREQAPDGKRATAGHRQVIDALLTAGNRPMPAEDLRAAASVGPGVIKTMLERGWLVASDEIVERDDEYDVDGPPTRSEEIQLTPRQQAVHDELITALHSGAYHAFLLHGVTGSGKTEIYLRVIEEGLRTGRSAIVLVPEISLTPQVVEAFRRRLGGVVGVYHSKLNAGQKFDLWRRIRARETRVVIGARSALFSPLPNLGVVIVDEEHEASYKQDSTPRYHARDMAVLRATRAGAVVILGSATPSIESLHNAREGKYRRLTLPERIGPHASPVMTVVDMKRHVSQGSGELLGGHLISPLLEEAIHERLRRGEQVLLLLNRRGFANQVMCLACSQSLQCPHCDVSLTYHKTLDQLMCHWCGYKQRVPAVCPRCNKAGEIHKLGLGTQRIEETLAEKFPGARSIRIDVDSMRRKGAFQQAWRAITQGEIDIILGTQMIAKGLHLERVTLVGVISADFALFLPDFRAAERTYSLLTQVAGRAGRGQFPGEVILQTFMPHHYAIDAAARLAEEAFYERELHIRRMLRFPPFSRLAGLILSGKDENLVRDQAAQLAGFLKTLAYRPRFRAVRVLGPTPAPIGRIEDQYRWRILIRSAHAGLLHTLLGDGLREFERHHKKSQVNLTLDIDPQDLL